MSGPSGGFVYVPELPLIERELKEKLKKRNPLCDETESLVSDILKIVPKKIPLGGSPSVVQTRLFMCMDVLYKDDLDSIIKSLREFSDLIVKYLGEEPE